MSDVATERMVCADCGADMVCSEHGLSLPCDMCEAEGSASSLLCGKCGKTEAREAEFDPLICHACGKVYLHGDDDGLCDDPMCGGAHLEPLLGFISYRRTYTSHRDPQEKNEAAVRIKERVEKVFHTQKVQGGFFIDKSGIEREDFAKKISSTIRACKGRVLLLILTPGALDPRDNDDENWMLNEIHLAIQHGMEIIPVKASNFRKDDDFRFPAKLPEEIRSIQKMNVNLSYIDDLEEHYVRDAIIRIANEVRRALDRIPGTSVSKENRQGSTDQKSIPKTSQSSQRKKSTEISSAVEQFNLGVKYANGNGVPKDDKEAVKWFRLAAEQGHATAQYSLGVMYTNGRGVPNEEEENDPLYDEAVNIVLGSQSASISLVQRHLRIGYNRAERLIKQMELTGIVSPLRSDGGRDVLFTPKGKPNKPEDDREAVKWFRLAAEQGHANAQYSLGVMYTNGRGVPKDDREAVKWYRLAAEQGRVDAQCRLAARYRNGKGAPQNYQEAAKWYRLAAEQGNANAQYNLGVMYADGTGVSKDDGEAVKWYRLAADQGHADAQLAIGACYQIGNGDDNEAVRWFRLAAEQGLAFAQDSLGFMYEKGRGAPQDVNEAAKWYRLAADQGHAKAKLRLETIDKPNSKEGSISLIRNIFGSFRK